MYREQGCRCQLYGNILGSSLCWFFTGLHYCIFSLSIYHLWIVFVFRTVLLCAQSCCRIFFSPLSTERCDVLSVCPVNTISEYSTTLMAQLAQSLNSVEEHSSNVKTQKLCIFHKTLVTSLRCLSLSTTATTAHCLITTVVLSPVQCVSERGCIENTWQQSVHPFKQLILYLFWGL